MRPNIWLRSLVAFSASILLLLSFASLAFSYGVYEAGGDGPLWSLSKVCRGIVGYTLAYSSMSDGQGKVNSFYVTYVSGDGKTVNDVEFGWLWVQPQEGKAPLFFSVGVRNNDYRLTRINWFPAGTDHQYKVIYSQPGGDGQKWFCYWDGVFQCTQSHTYLIDGWSNVGGERSLNCGGNAEFRSMRRWTSSKWVWWSSPTDWPNFHNDPNYRFIRHTATEGWIRPGQD